MVQILGGQAVVQTLLSLGARSGFGVPGESYLAVLDAFYDAPGFRFIGCRNEGGAAFMAEAWAKLTGEVGLCFVTRGPGATNASIGVHTAMQASTPMLLFVGQVGLEHQGREAFQELDYRQVFGPIAKYATEITDVSRTPEIICRAWSMAISGRPGPVVVALPEDVLTQSADIEIPTVPILAPKSAVVAADLEQLAARLQSAQRPVILVGGGRWDAQDRSALLACAHKLNVPVVTGFRYHDLFDNTDPLFVGEAGVGMTANTKRVLTEADVVLAVNLRFGEMTTDAFTLFGANRGEQWIAQSHRSGDEFHKYVTPNLSMISDPAPLLDGLKARLEVAGMHQDLAWAKSARAGFKATQTATAQPSPVDMGVVTSAVQTLLPADAIVTNGAGNFAIWPNKFLQFSEHQRLLAPQSGAMGYGLPAAIAAKVEYPERCVLCFAGDGDFQMNCQELGAALQADARPIVLIVNNGSYGTIRMHQERHFPRRVSGTEIINPDFAALARAYGFHGERVERTEEFADAFSRALASPTGAVLDLNVASEAITPGMTIKGLHSLSEG
ncbi:thiamine pyrophosphate-dependent enzyme [Planktomarina sp.]|uniref:thiamine pyrophosphate-dependent enzyme n=1 Tax=Planktomarina sp. TaxID=2024851 RepID=UPI00288F0D44|nr:thiamine pyrophosphate-binding protein [Planktomarina sp.]